MKYIKSLPEKVLPTHSPTLRIQQAWLQTLTTHPKGLFVGAALASQRYDFKPEELVKPGHLGIKRRLAIYANGYLLRLMECLSADYPALKVFLGDEVFTYFAKAYIAYQPSNSYTLFDFGEKLSEFLAQSRPKACSVPDELKAQYLIPEQLAHLERLRILAMRAQGCESRNPDFSFDMFNLNRRLQLAPSTHIAHFDFDFLTCFSDLERGKHSVPILKSQHLLIYRHKYRVYMEVIEDYQFEFLLLCKKPITVQCGIQTLCEKKQLDAGELISQLTPWLYQLQHKSIFSLAI